MKKTLLQSLFGLMSVMMLAVLVGCTPPGEEGAVEEGEGAASEAPAVDVYKIGAIFSVTGPAAFLGDPEKKTAEMIEKQINEAGGINGVPIEIIIEDDAGSEDKTKNAASKLIDKDNVLAIIGPTRSGNTMAIKDMMEEKQVSLVSAAAAEAIVNPVNPWVFKTPQKDSFVAEHIFKYMKDNGLMKVAVMYGGTGFGQEGLKQCKAFASKYGVEVAMEEVYAPSATDSDIETLLTKIKSEGSIQAIINWSILPAQSVVPKKMKELSMNDIQLFHSHGFGNIKYVQNAGAAANGVIFPCGRLLVAESLPEGNPQKKPLSEYKKSYETTYSEDISTFGGHAYDALWIVVKAIEKAGADRSAIRDEIEKTTGFVGTGGIFNITPEDHNGLGLDSLEMLTVKDGQFALLN